ncbi:hypothetical protein ACQP1W_21865 [Spirillospora sp. CA-255316]
MTHRAGRTGGIPGGAAARPPLDAAALRPGTPRPGDHGGDVAAEEDS